MSNNLKAHTALFTVNLIYAANYLIAKGVMPDYLQAFGFIFFRVLGAVMLFWILNAFNRERIEKRDYLRLVFCGLFGVALNQLTFFKGLSYTSPINASLIMTFNPAIVLIISFLVLKETITTRKLIGICVGAIGAIYLISKSSSELNSSVFGDVLILINATSYGVYLVLVKPLMKKYKPKTVISWVFLFGFLFVIPFGLEEALTADFLTMPNEIIYSIIYVVIGTTFLAYLLNIYALKLVSPAVSSSYIYLQPFLTALFIFILSLFNKDKYVSDLNIEKAGAGILIFLGIYLISSTKKAPEKREL